jgi:hypothetical protein
VQSVGAFNYMKPNASIPNKIAHYAKKDAINQEYHLKLPMSEKRDKEADNKNKKPKKDKNRKHTRDIIVNQPAQRFNVPPHHEYQNVTEQQAKLLQLSETKVSILRKIGDPIGVPRCPVLENGVYILHSETNSLTSFAEMEEKKNNNVFDFNSDLKLKNFNLSKYLNVDVKYVSSSSRNSRHTKTSDEKQDSSSKSSSLSNKSTDSVEQAIISNGLKNSDLQINSYLGPFNFRKLLRPTGLAPTESLRKRKLN